MRTVLVSNLEAGQEVYLPDVKSWHVLGYIEKQYVNIDKPQFMAWFGESSHGQVLRDLFYAIR